MTNALVVTLSVILALIGTVDYIKNIIFGTTRPHRVTRIMLVIVTFGGLAGSVMSHAGVATIVLSAVFFARCLVLAMLSIWRGIGGQTKSDIACGLIAAVGIAVSFTTGSGLWALIFAVAADMFTYIPTIIKTWRLPKSESPLFYILDGVAAVIVVMYDGFVLKSLFQIYIATLCLLMVLLIFRPHKGNQMESLSTD